MNLGAVPSSEVASPGLLRGPLQAGVFERSPVRIPLLVPCFGERWAELAEMPAMFVTLFWAAGFIVRRYGKRVRPSDWIGVGAIALVLVVLAELLLAAVLAGRGVADYVANRDPVSGSVYAGMLLAYAAMPWLRRGLGPRTLKA